MEMNILYGLQGLHGPFLDQVMVKVFNDFVGAKGELWIILGILLLLFPRAKKTGLCVLSAYIIAYYVGDGLLKNLIARPRPCAVDETVALLISRPTSFSCPSVHSMLAFASASPIFRFHKKAGAAALVFALLIAFSRMYFFVHFPTDVLFGAVLGSAIGMFVCFCADGRQTGKKAADAEMPNV